MKWRGRSESGRDGMHGEYGLYYLGHNGITKECDFWSLRSHFRLRVACITTKITNHAGICICLSTHLPIFHITTIKRWVILLSFKPDFPCYFSDFIWFFSSGNTAVTKLVIIPCLALSLASLWALTQTYSSLPFHKSRPIQSIDEAVTRKSEHLFKQKKNSEREERKKKHRRK